LLKESEKKFRDIFNNVNDAIHIHEIEPDGRPGRFIDVNEVACRMLQYPRDEMLRHTPLDFATDSHSRPIGQILEELITVRNAVFETGHMRKDGTIIPVEVNAHLITLQGKKVVLSVVRDITERKRVENALKESEEFLNKIINTISDPIHVKDRQHRIILINKAACRLFNLSREEIIGKTAYDLFPSREMADISWQKDEEVFKTGVESVNEETNTYAFGKTLNVLVKKTLYTDTANNQFLVGITTDITERHKTEEAQRELTEFRESVITNARVWLSVLNQHGKILMWNSAAEEISGYRADEVIGKNEIWKLLYPKKEYRKHITDTINRIIHDKKYLENFETTILSKPGNERVISWNTKGIPDATGKISDYIAIGVDVTDRHLVEQMLRESEEKFRTVLENVPDLVLVHRNGVILYVNPAVVQMLGYTSDEVVNKPIIRYIVSEYHPTVAQAISRRMNGENVEPYEVEILTKSGVRRTVIVRGSLIEFAGSPASINVLTDITERKQVEEALRETGERYRSLFDRSLDCVYIHDFAGNFIDANPSALNLLGYTRDKITALNFTSLLTPDQIPLALKVIQEVITTGTQKESSEYRVRRKDGAYADVETTATLLYHHGKPYAIQGFAHDITERKHAEEKLKKFNEVLEQRVKERTEQINASLEEKVILLREIHHRVKNNLQIIISLLKLQSRYIDDDKTRQALNESQNRLRAMALVHERIYRSSNIAEINLKDYLGYLTKQIFSFSNIPSNQIGMKITMEDIMSNIDTLVPVGLIVNELVSNSLKHAFPDGNRGEISIAIQRKNAMLTILFKDTGVGIPADLDWRNADSLGLRLVILLVDQLDGTIELDRSAGTVFTIVVKEKE
jgi:PAS domain S-box-containing protein